MNLHRGGIGMTSQRTRLRMVDKLRADGIKDETVLAMMADLPRHAFVDEALQTRAYDDVPLPIGFGQTISSPYIVARMSELARGGQKLNKVLEVGTGCGYQTAVLAKLAREVYSIERIADLQEKARANLRPLRLTNIRLKHGDGMLGLREVAPFDGIVVTAAAAEVPQELREQLQVGGRLVIPIGIHEQVLTVVERGEQGFVEKRLEAVRFVPLLSGVG